MIKTFFMDIRQLQEHTVYEKALSYISPYRRQKIALLKHQKDKDRSLAAALSLHQALTEYGLEERMMEYDTGAQGKPYFRYHPEICFSLSHSGDYAICSIGEETIGNDIEQIRDGRLGVAERFFAADEVLWIKQAETAEEKDGRMFRLWTLKESFLKVTGLGMSLPLKDFTVCIAENGTVRIRQSVDEKIYFAKEYQMPVLESEEYKISLCSTCADFAPKIEQIQVQNIMGML